MKVDPRYCYTTELYNKETWRLINNSGAYVEVKIILVRKNDGVYCRSFLDGKTRRVTEKNFQSLAWWKNHAEPAFYPYTWAFDRCL